MKIRRPSRRLSMCFWPSFTMRSSRRAARGPRGIQKYFCTIAIQPLQVKTFEFQRSGNNFSKDAALALYFRNLSRLSGRTMPAYASHSVDYAILQLGGRIHEERRRQGFTLQELAARSGISVSRLSQIENGHHILDAVQADAIAEAFGLSLEAFLPADVTIPYVIARDAEIRTAPLAGEPAECIQVISSGSTPLSPGQDWRLAGFFPEGDSEDGRAQVIGRELGALRESRGWTTEQVARMVGLKDRHLEQIEAGTRRLPLDVMIRLARVFGKPLREFLRN